jgi:hypothetical protein
MKIYFDGCSNTHGSELIDPLNTRFSKLVCNHFNAEEYNIGRVSGSDRRMARNLLEHDLSQYDMFVIQLTQKARSEYWCERDKRWKVLRHLLKRKRLNDHLQVQVTDIWKKFLKHVYTDELGTSNQLMYYTLMKILLKDRPHVIIGIDFYHEFFIGDDNNISAPVDLRYEHGEPKRLNGKIIRSKTKRCIPRCIGGHPTEEGHRYIADDIIEWFS